MGKQIFGSGDKVRPLQISSWGEVGECLDAFDWIYGQIRPTRSWRGQRRTWILSKQLKTYRTNWIQRPSTVNNGFNLIHSFNLVQKHNERMAYIKHEETYSKQRRNTIKNRTPQGSQQVPQNPWSFLSQNMKSMYNDIKSIPRVQPVECLRNYNI